MRYCSTRGGVQGWGFQQVLFSGYAPDGGMFMPEALPALSPDTLKLWTSMSYPELVLELCSLFIPHDVIPHDDLKDLLSQALYHFSVPGAVRLVRLEGGLCLLELFHGETLAFKDLAMRCTAHLLQYFLRKENRRAVVLVGTSGDTGGSAIRSVCGLQGLDVVVVFPRGRITSIQERQMTTSLEDNVHVFAADGSSDDIDVPLRRLFADQDLVKRHGLMSLNSVNWVRILVQLAHFLYAYLQLSGIEQVKGHVLPSLEVVVPTGGAGNIAAGCILKQMGVPLRLVAMVNRNDTVHRAVESGDFSMADSVKKTLASAIDIQDPYNMERVFWLLSGGDSALVKRLMEEFQDSHRTVLPGALHKKLSSVLSAGSVTDEGIVETMQKCWQDSRYLLCPHTAVAVWHHYHCPLRPGESRCCIATASPVKFQEAVHRAGLTLELPEGMQRLKKMRTRCAKLEEGMDWESQLRERIEHIRSVRERGELYYSA
ncbi:threonine synthase-like 2 isoform X1 [Scleropages formosus]|uniref:Threonine synthase-like 2 n=2 Tax=Scleropages formosus TaxID=113540 RepID=A0A8C9TR48_SCLFO|nr:threonine synthase-like 2 isoform X1 [Scleropages formosus]XP_018589856.1 threonine synthase-like 2 isoform X1 [Scleropages formosus]